jgi:hypothetical protein
VAAAVGPLGGVAVAESNFAIALDITTVSPGNVAVVIDNTGTVPHELLGFRTDLAEDQLPLGPDGRINEDAVPKVIDTDTDLPPGTHRTLSTTLSPGRYVFVCNLLNHYRLGMHTVLIVK